MVITANFCYGFDGRSIVTKLSVMKKVVVVMVVMVLMSGLAVRAWCGNYWVW